MNMEIKWKTSWANAVRKKASPIRAAGTGKVNPLPVSGAGEGASASAKTEEANTAMKKQNKVDLVVLICAILLMTELAMRFGRRYAGGVVYIDR
ncbi:hypothetical protein L1987_59986 [Smallanthus sonchifolius]|uniref:Uncharacterized protein n=1 Tax=Smallanthus sonchifolius TaxID=185202 RepID=A0ACB9D717_9ASTR|nr:hypothetical protein L1987_59986 [Smallanthus sonchifolius]